MVSQNWNNQLNTMEENNILDKDLYAESIRAALEVDFLNNREEVRMYATSLYNAMMWAKNHTNKVK